MPQTLTTPRYLVLGTVPAGSPATALAGRTVRLPARTTAEVEQRVAEACRAGCRPRVAIR